jgi:hypothetical protein
VFDRWPEESDSLRRGWREYPNVSENDIDLRRVVINIIDSYIEKGFDHQMVVRIVDVHRFNAFLSTIVQFQVIDVLIEKALHVFIGQIDA